MIDRVQVVLYTIERKAGSVPVKDYLVLCAGCATVVKAFPGTTLLAITEFGLGECQLHPFKKLGLVRVRIEAREPAEDFSRSS